MLQLLYSQKGNKLQEELLKRNKQNLNVRHTATRCIELGKSFEAESGKLMQSTD